MKRNTRIVIDPVKMNIVNRIAHGSAHVGALNCIGGLLLEGSFDGDLTISGGPLVLAEQGSLKGRVVVHSDAYLFGKLGGVKDDSTVTISGQAHFAQTVRSTASVQCKQPVIYEGAQLAGQLATLDSEIAQKN